MYENPESIENQKRRKVIFSLNQIIFFSSKIAEKMKEKTTIHNIVYNIFQLAGSQFVVCFCSAQSVRKLNMNIFFLLQAEESSYYQLGIELKTNCANVYENVKSSIIMCKRENQGHFHLRMSRSHFSCVLILYIYHIAYSLRRNYNHHQKYRTLELAKDPAQKA